MKVQNQIHDCMSFMEFRSVLKEFFALKKSARNNVNYAVHLKKCDEILDKISDSFDDEYENINQLDMDKIFEIMTEEKANQKEKLRIPMERVESFFKRGTPPSVMIETVIKALELYRRALNQQKRAEQGTLFEGSK